MWHPSQEVPVVDLADGLDGWLCGFRWNEYNGGCVGFVGHRYFSLSESRITADLADFTDYEVYVYPTSIVQRWVSLDIFAIAGIRNKHNFLEMVMLDCRPFNPTYGTKQNRLISSNRHAPTTAVNVDRLTRDVGGIVAEKEGDRGCNFFRSTTAFHDARNDWCLL